MTNQVQIQKLLATDVDKLSEVEAAILATEIRDVVCQGGVPGDALLGLQNKLLAATEKTLPKKTGPNVREDIRQRIFDAHQKGDLRLAQSLQQSLANSDEADIHNDELKERVQREQQERFAKFEEGRQAEAVKRRDEAIEARTQELLSRTDVPMDAIASRNRPSRTSIASRSSAIWEPDMEQDDTRKTEGEGTHIGESETLQSTLEPYTHEQLVNHPGRVLFNQLIADHPDVAALLKQVNDALPDQSMRIVFLIGLMKHSESKSSWLYAMVKAIDESARFEQSWNKHKKRLQKHYKDGKPHDLGMKFTIRC